MKTEYESKSTGKQVFRLDTEITIVVSAGFSFPGVLYETQGQLFAVRRETFNNEFEICQKKKT
jgi:hypothetical protein